MRVRVVQMFGDAEPGDLVFSFGAAFVRCPTCKTISLLPSTHTVDWSTITVTPDLYCNRAKQPDQPECPAHYTILDGELKWCP